MSNVKIELNHAGIKALLQSNEMQGILREHAEATKSGCGELSDEYSVNVSVGKNRAKAVVKPDTVHARRSNLKHDTLIKALK
ncbi:hypothetical protein [Aminicella lysinilytica]|uniref:Uncharacterized protein n=1 Tax=Aminicella lysinilytica TaxID=433323 RepID=A0A4R6QCH5_9FIRM|nr:hypothetical protein [Aminicella lysinilytica]TDP59847.1 hypothetical protein EV211_10289 [Aminicella lysinilytica]